MRLLARAAVPDQGFALCAQFCDCGLADAQKITEAEMVRGFVKLRHPLT